MPRDPKSGAPLGDAAVLPAPVAPALPRQLVDGDDLAKILSVSGRTIKRLYRSGKIDGIPVGDRLRFDPVEVIAQLKAQAAAERAAKEGEKK